MGKPRIILADTDPNFIIPIQLKFVQEFFEKVDLEIITDRAYFEKVFSTPQRADIVVISEDLYSDALLRHSISNLFLMTEQQEEGQTAGLNVTRIFKYTSIKEIFNEISGKSAEALKLSSDEKKAPRIIMAYSAAGGTGKTTVAMGIATCLTKNYKKVLYINATRLQTFQHLLENPSAAAGSEVYDKLAAADINIYEEIKHIIRKEQFYYLPPLKAALMSLGIPYSVYLQIALSAKKSGEFDYIVLDTDAVFDEYSAQMLNAADKVVIVTDQSMGSVYATNILAANINGVNSEKYVFICNRFEKDKDNALIAPSLSVRFSVSDYIDMLEHIDTLKCADFLKVSGIQRTAFLVM